MGGPGKTGTTLPINPIINSIEPMIMRVIFIDVNVLFIVTKVYKKKIPLGEGSGYFHKNSKMNLQK